MIDLHTHTTASDGRCAPGEMVANAAAAGVTVLSVTDHDTVAACDMVRDACRDKRIAFVPGIEITAVRDEVDVHILGYFIDPAASGLLAFLAEQRQRRVERVRRILARLDELGMPIDADQILRPALEHSGKSIGRPQVARALIAAGHVQTTDDAFAAWLSRGRPAFVAREGPAPESVIAQIHSAAGVASLAHPGLLRRDEWIPGFVAAGLDALEAYHTNHDANETSRYRALSDRLGLAVSGGSDYHGDQAHGSLCPGSTALPQDDFDRLSARAKRDATAATPRS